MKRLIRSIINWAYGCNLSLEIFHLQEASKNLGITLENAIKRLYMEVKKQ